MIGQEKLISKIDTFNISNLPHSILLLGAKGSGHLDICDYIATKFGFYSMDISEMISTEFINQIYLSSSQTLYTIDLTKISEKEQNVLLKLFEEPNAFTYIVLYGESTYNVLETIQTRSYMLNMDSYTREQLEPLITQQDKEYILSICSTPGQIEIANHTDLNKLRALCETIITKLKTANFANSLTIANKVNFTDEYDKYDLNLFITVLGNTMLKMKEFTLYNCLNKLNKNIGFMYDKKRYFEHFIIEAWKVSRGL